MPSPSVIHTQLTDAKATKLSNRGQPKDLFVRDIDLRGFGLRVSPNDVKAFFVEATVHGRFTRKVLGRHPLLTVKDARNRALEALRQLREVGLPATQGLASNRCFIELVGAFITDRKQVLKPRTLSDYQDALVGKRPDTLV